MTQTEVVDGIAVRREEAVAVVPVPRALTGTAALAALSEDEFQLRLRELHRGHDRIQQIKRELMRDDVHYGRIPGSDSPSLLKPGAELLCSIFGLVAEPIVTLTYGDNETRPAIGVRVRALIHQGNIEGPVVGVGEGAANSWMPKYKYRSAKRACPACGTVGSIRKSKYPDKETGDFGWWCREESCKANFVSTDPAVVGQVVGTIENPDPHGDENTLIKMAIKSAVVDGTLRATASSDLFTQDVEDLDDDDKPGKGRPPAGASSGPAAEAVTDPKREGAAVAGSAPAKNGGSLPACSRCGHNRSVIRSRYQAGGYVCWSGAKEPGCGYKFTDDDLRIQAAAAAERQAKGVGEDGEALPFDK